MQIAEHTFLITGGSSGLGKATSLRLVQQGANVIIADLNVEAGGELANNLKSQSLFIQTDVTDPSSIENALFKATECFGELHGLINCAGILVAERMIKKDGSLSTRMLSVNVWRST